jgi:hypothetical protein
MFNKVVEQFMQDSEPKIYNKISMREYQDWASGFIFEALRHQRYGQSFCNRFNITDNILFYTNRVEDADLYIRENYVE